MTNHYKILIGKHTNPQDLQRQSKQKHKNYNPIKDKVFSYGPSAQEFYNLLTNSSKELIVPVLPVLYLKVL